MYIIYIGGCHDTSCDIDRFWPFTCHAEYIIHWNENSNRWIAWVSVIQASKKEIGPPSDVFAFGCVIVTLYSEVPLWPGLTPFQIMCKVTIHKEKPDMSDVPGELRVLCEKCLDYNIANRPAIIEVQKGLARIKV